MPRFSSTGLGERPTRFSSEKFCMLRAPTWSTSAYCSTRSQFSGSMVSVTMASPNWRRTSARIFRPSSPRPWKL